MSGTSSLREIVVCPGGPEELLTFFDSQLRHRRAFVQGDYDFLDREACLFVVVHPNGRRFAVPAEAVYVRREEPGAGVGLDLTGLDPGRLAELEQWVRAPASKPPSAAPVAKNAMERIRHLSLRERDGVARQGSLSDRVALERIFGSSVWEALLQNPQLTVPEVAHVARNGTLPVPLISLIVANQAWLSSGEVRRALLSNPRVTGSHLDRVLCSMPKVELKQIVRASPYRAQVKTAAKNLIRE